MARALVPFALVAVCLVPTATAFDLDAYRAHLERTRGLTAAALVAQHRPYGPYWEYSPAPAAPPEFLDLITKHFALSSGELDLLSRHGFVVSERLSSPSFGDALLDIWHADLPVFVSSDAILHALHKAYVDILAEVEKNFLAPDLHRLLAALHSQWPALEVRYREAPGMRVSLADVDVYLTVARSLLQGERLSPAGFANDAAFRELFALVQAEKVCTYPLFNETERICDFSQLKPRGHYTQSETLSRYFRAMMWLGRTEMRLTEPPGLPETPDVRREIVDAFLVRELMLASGAAPTQERMESILRPLVGTADNVTLVELEKLAAVLGIEKAEALLDDGTRLRFQSELASGAYTAQGINSQILIANPMDPEAALDPPYAFLLFGQRFVLDSYITWNVVFDRIEHQGSKVFRGLPATFDILYALGNDDVLPLLQAELETYRYAPNLSALRYLIDSYEPEFWRQSLYTVWLQAIRSLAHSGRQPGVPDFMRTVAWQQEKMNTQLASWTELRHDNLLYAKQSYTGGAVCSFPRSYVEPIPALYRHLESFALDAGRAFGNLPSAGGLRERIVLLFDHWAETMARLGTIAQKELDGTSLSLEESEFLQQMLTLQTAGCTDVEDGWYRRLFFSMNDKPASEPDLLIADVHTQPTDAGGAFVGHVLHVATGNPDLGVFVAAPPGLPLTAFAGPVASHHQHVTANFERLTDQEWQALYAQSPPERPDWTYVYLANASGVVRSGGRRLAAGEPPQQRPPASSRTPPHLVLAQNVPNPFNPMTSIPFRLEVSTPVPVQVAIFDTRGRRVRTLLDELLPSANYVVRWDGADDFGSAVASGTYVVRVEAGSMRASRKILLLR